MPKLTESVLRVTVNPVPTGWARLRAPSGYRRKLLFAALQARDRGAHGIVATVDTDKRPPRERLNKLRKARTELRNNGNDIPIALGEADPHAEAWLLDDQVAVREGLELPADTNIPNVRDVHPKNKLDAILAERQREGKPIDLLPGIASRVQLGRSPHAAETGLLSFVKDLKDLQREIARLCETTSTE